MTTTAIDTSFINSFLDGSVTKEDVFSEFNYNSASLYFPEDIEVYKNSVTNLVKLSYVIKNNYIDLSDDNKRIVLELIQNYLVCYFNYFRRTLINTDVVSSHEDIIEETIDAIGYFITRFHYKMKYYELRNLPTPEFISYISMEEGLTVNSQLESTYLQTLESLKPPSYGLLTDEFNITRGKIHQIINLIKSNSLDEAYNVLIDIILEDNNSTPVPPVEPDSLMSLQPQIPVINEMTDERINQINKTITELMTPSEDLVNMTNEDIKNKFGDDIDMEILLDTDLENIDNQDYKTFVPSTSTINETNVINNDIDEITENDVFQESKLEDILEDYLDPWDYNINEIMKIIINYMDTMYQSLSYERKNITKTEIKTMLYIMSFIKSDNLV
jgi:hypothetical protein